jgi:hypothetical protein
MRQRRRRRRRRRHIRQIIPHIQPRRITMLLRQQMETISFQAIIINIQATIIIIIILIIIIIINISIIPPINKTTI